MAQRKPEEQSTLNQVLKLVDSLSSDEQEQLRQDLSNRTWGQRWDALVKKVQEQSRNLPPVTDEEIVAEMKAIRREVLAGRAQSSR